MKLTPRSKNTAVSMLFAFAGLTLLLGTYHAVKVYADISPQAAIEANDNSGKASGCPFGCAGCTGCALATQNTTTLPVAAENTELQVIYHE